MLVTGLVLQHAEVQPFTQYASHGCFLLAYLLIGWTVFRTAVVLFADGNILNEYLLIGIATLATFAIGRYSESVTVLLLYTLGVVFQEAALNRAGRSVGKEVNLDALAQVRITVEDAVRRTGKTHQFITKFALVYTPLVLFMAQFLVVVPALAVQDFVLKDWLYRAMEFVLIACPRSLVISVPLGYLCGVVAASRKRILFKGPESIELMRKLDTLVIDESATITPGTFEAIRELREQGIKHIVMLSGEEDAIAQRVANELGITAAYSELTPERKFEHLQKLKASGAKVAFASNVDGASAMAVADMGIAMGELGSGTTIQTANVVIQTGHPSEISTARRISAVTHRVVWQNIWLALLAKAILLGLAAGGLVTLWEAVLVDIGIALLTIVNAGRIQWMDFSAARMLP